MARLQFYDYHNMVAILEKGEFNTDFHPMVDFIAVSPLRIETTNEGTHILATMDGIQRTVSEASFRRNLKLRDADGIVYIPDTKLFENLTLMGYNISQNQKLTFQKGQLMKNKREKDKIGTKPDKNGKRGEAEKSQEQFQSIKEEKPKKTQKEWSKTHAQSRSY
nr:hypothetical protein [Tanacetum cinerariifolium]